MIPAKLKLSKEEKELISDANVILTKNMILKKTESLLGHLSEQQIAYTKKEKSTFPEEILKLPPKISKGENYLGLPYRVLDYPRFFDNKDIFLVRTMFWWGNFFSVTIQLAGKYKTAFEKKLQERWPELQENGIYFCINEDPWQHHFENANYLPCSDITLDQLESYLGKTDFLKMAIKEDLDTWENAREILFAHFTSLSKIVAES